MLDTFKKPLIGAIILFVWGMISWTVLPWHTAVMNEFKSEKAVALNLNANATVPGIYTLPADCDNIKPGETFAFVNVLPDGFSKSMPQMMITGFLIQLLLMFFAVKIYEKSGETIPSETIGLYSLLGIFAGLAIHLPMWNWFGFPLNYTALNILDIAIGWTLVGAVMSRIK